MAVSPEVKAAVDRILSEWSGATGKGSAQGVIRNFSNLADSVFGDVSGASDEQRLQYAMAVLSGFKEASPFFSDRAYKSWMGHINPLVQAYKPAQEVFPLWKSTSEMMETRYGGGGEDSYTYQEPAGVNYEQWVQSGIAQQLGFTGSPYEAVGYDTGEGGGPVFGISNAFKQFVDQKRAEGYDFVQYQPDLRNYRQKYGFRLPSGEVTNQFYGEGRDADVTSFLKNFVLPAAGIAFGANMLGGGAGGGAGAAGAGMDLLGGSADLAGAMGGGQFAAAGGAGNALTLKDIANLPTSVLGGGGEAVGAGGATTGADLAGGAAVADPEMAKLLRQQEIAQAGGSALGGIGPGAVALPLVGAAAGSAGSLLDKAINFVTSPQGAAIVGGVGNVVGGIAAGEAAKEAAQTQAAAADKALQLQTRIYEDFQRMNKPYYEAGVNALGQITRGEIPMEPGYGFRLGEGMKALERLQSARGSLLGGGAIKAGQRYAQDFASQEYGNAYNRLANLAGIGQTAASQAGAAGQQYGTQAGELGLQAANALTQGRIGRTSSYTGGLMGAANALQNYTAQQRQEDMFNRLLTKYMPG